MSNILGERLSDPETEEVLRDCMEKEDEDGFVPYDRKLLFCSFFLLKILKKHCLFFTFATYKKKKVFIEH